MTKRCPECKTDLPVGAGSCSKCGFILVKRPTESEELAEEQEKRIIQGVSSQLAEDKRFLWKVSWRTLAWFFSLLGLAFGWGIWSAVQNLNHLAASRFDALDRNMSNLVMEANARIVTNIAGQFQEPRIRKTVEDVAGKEAKAILEGEVRPTVDSFRADAEFLRLATRARAYDFRAYLRLLELQKGTNELAHYAEQVLSETDRSLERDRSEFMPHRIYMIFGDTNSYAGPFTSDELAIRFANVAQDKTAYNREGFVNTVGELKQPLFLASLVVLLTNETDLGVADRVTIAISSVAKEDFHPHDFERIQTWWHLHGNEYTNWPVSGFDRGLDEWGKGNVSEAGKCFEEILKLDPSADMSRALEISLRLKMGETNKAVELAKGFKSPTARWAQWASSCIELETGSVSNATVQFADFTRKNPTMGSFFPKEENAYWSKMDWQLFHKLISGEKR